MNRPIGQRHLIRGTHARTLLRASLLVLFIPSGVTARVPGTLLDAFDDIRGWHGVTSHGSASSVSLRSVPGRTGNAMLIEYSFLGHMGSAAAEKTFNVPLPAGYQISFDLRGEGPPNNFVIRLMDSLDNVWWINRSNFVFPGEWTRMTIRKSQIQYGWGPSGGGDLRRLDRIMLMVDVVEGGKGKIWIDNLAVEPLDEGGGLPLRVTASSAEKGHSPHPEGTAVIGWRTPAREAWLNVDCAYVRDIGGLVIRWEEGRGAGSFDVLLSDDGRSWRKGYGARDCSSTRSYVCLGDAAARFVRLDLRNAARGRGFGIKRLELKGSEFGFSMNDFFRGIASEAPRGYYPRYLYNEQSYWTVVGVPGDSKKAIINNPGRVSLRINKFTRGVRVYP